MKMFEILQSCQEKARPASFEQDTAELLRELACNFSDEMFVDTLGNVICRKKGPGKKIIVPAHMDCFGFMINHIDEKGCLYFQHYGKFKAACLIGQAVLLEGGIGGVILPLEHSHAKKLGKLDISDLYIDIGCDSFEEASEYVSRGSYGVYHSPAAQMEDGYIRMSGGDNLVGCAALLAAMERLGQTDNDVYFVFTTMNKPGPSGRGAMVAAYRIQPYAGISIGTTGTNDVLHRSSFSGSAKLRGGPAVKIKEDRYLSDPLVVEHIKEAAEAAGVSGQTWQAEIWPQSMASFADPDRVSDMVSLQNCQKGIFAGGISIPLRYAQAVNQIFHIEDLQKTVELLCASLEKNF